MFLSRLLFNVHCLSLSIYTCLFLLLASYLSLTQKKSQRLFFFICPSLSTQGVHQTFSDLVFTVMEADWDLHAVVRSCTTPFSAAATSTTSSSAFGASIPPSTSCNFFSGYNPAVQGGQVVSLPENPYYEGRTSMEELQELCKPFLLKPQPQTFQPSSPLSSFSYSPVPKSPRSQQEQKQPPQAGSASTPKLKRRFLIYIYISFFFLSF